MNKKLKIYLFDCIAALYILIFVYAALSKFHDFEKFRIDVGKSPLLNSNVGLVTVSIPLIELIVAVMLATKRFQYFAMNVAFCLMVIFSSYIIVILKFSSYIPCSCGGILQNMTWTQHLIFNITVTTLAVLAILIYPGKEKDLICAK